MEKIVILSKRRGFVFPSSEIYGGLGSCWDYGPLGVALKRDVKEAWWRSVVGSRPDVVGLDCSILMHPEVWVASGHVENFSDPLVDCKDCKSRFRADHIEGDGLGQADSFGQACVGITARHGAVAQQRMKDKGATPYVGVATPTAME